MIGSGSEAKPVSSLEWFLQYAVQKTPPQRLWPQLYQGGVSLKMNHEHCMFAADPDLMGGFLISNGQSSQLGELIVLAGANKWWNKQKDPNISYYCRLGLSKVCGTVVWAESCAHYASGVQPCEVHEGPASTSLSKPMSVFTAERWEREAVGLPPVTKNQRKTTTWEGIVGKAVR